MRKTGKQLSADLGEVFSYGLREERYRKETVEEILLGRLSADFRVPAADTAQELFFNNLDLLARFTSLCCPDQRAFLVAVRKTMESEGVNTIRLKVKWAANGEERNIVISKVNDEGYLNIYL